MKIRISVAPEQLSAILLALNPPEPPRFQWNFDQSWRENYNRMLQSDYWKHFRNRVLQDRNHRCQRCGTTKGPLQVHHRTYDRVSRELLSDVELVCKPCHVTADRERAAEGRYRAANALYDARVNGWANKKYGEGWQDYMDVGSVEEEFDDWVESKGDW